MRALMEGLTYVLNGGSGTASQRSSVVLATVPGWCCVRACDPHFIPPVVRMLSCVHVYVLGDPPIPVKGPLTDITFRGDGKIELQPLGSN